MGEFTDYCEATFPANGGRYITEGAGKVRDQAVQEVAELAQRISVDPALVPNEPQIRTLVSAFGSVDDVYPRGYRINFCRIDQNLGWCFGEERGNFPDLAEQPVVTAMAMVGSRAVVMAEFGLVRFPNVDVGKVAIEMGIGFAKTSKEACFCHGGCTHAYPFNAGALSAASLRDILPEQDAREGFVRDCLKKTFGEYEANPTEETKWLLRRGQNVVGALLRYPEEFMPDTLNKAVHYATKYGCPGLAYALKKITDKPALIKNKTIPLLSPEAAEDTVTRYEQDYRYEKGSTDSILNMLQFVPNEQRPALIRMALPQAEEWRIDILSAVSPRQLLSIIQPSTTLTS